MRGDLLALKVALAPCVIGYAEIATRLASRPDAHAATNPYRVWIAEYAGAPYQEVAAKARAHLEGLADLYVTPAREAELIVIFKEATRLEADFWEMGWRAGQRVEQSLTAYRVGRVTALLSTAKAKASKRSTGGQRLDETMT
jgi:thiaminase/transcriptional activator TenA